MGIVGGLIILLALTVAFWVAVWIVIGLYCGRRWGVNEYVVAGAAVIAGPLGLLGAYAYARSQRRRSLGESDTKVPDNVSRPASPRSSSGTNEAPDF